MQMKPTVKCSAIDSPTIIRKNKLTTRNNHLIK